VAVWAVLSAAPGVTAAQEQAPAEPEEAPAERKLPEWLERTRISGYVFGDAYYFLEDADPDVDGQNGFWIRRIYLTVDSEISDSLSARLRFEVNSPGDFLPSSTNLEPYVKNAYLRWSNGGRDLYVGLSDTPTWDVIEETWGYRFVEKTPLDLHRFGTSADVGLALQGAFDGEAERFRYNVMVSNGTGTRGESDAGKKAMLATGWYPDDHWIFEVYGDLESREGENDRRTFQLFGAYQSDRWRAGLQAARQTQEVPLADERDIDLASAFAVFTLSPRVNLLLRYDVLFDPSPEGNRIPYLPFDTTADSQLAIVGLDFELHKSVNLSPNVEAIFYDRDAGDPRPEPDDTVAARVTLFWRF
jgi:hypothetical protein